MGGNEVSPEEQDCSAVCLNPGLSVYIVQADQLIVTDSQNSFVLILKLPTKLISRFTKTLMRFQTLAKLVIISQRLCATIRFQSLSTFPYERFAQVNSIAYLE